MLGYDGVETVDAGEKFEFLFYVAVAVVVWIVVGSLLQSALKSVKDKLNNRRK
jgi:hypothetical protein